MGAIGGLLGTGGGDNGTGQTITNPTTADQLQNAYGAAQNSQQSQQALIAALQGQNGIQNQSQVYNQLQGVANGTGPNPAQAMLNQATGQNVQNQAALMAGQRGAGANVGLMARQAAQTGAGIQQNAAGQSATLQANQSLNALGQAGNIANTQVGSQIGATTANTQAAQSEQGLLNNANAGVNSISGQLANTITQGQQGLVGGVLGGIGSAIGLANGGEAQKYAGDGTISAPQSAVGSFLSGWAGGNQQPAAPVYSGSSGPSSIQQGMTKLGAGIGGGAALANGGDVGSKMKSGGQVPGKPKMPFNSYSNDVVKADLTPGENVIDLDTMKDPGPVGQAARFVSAAIAKRNGLKGLRK